MAAAPSQPRKVGRPIGSARGPTFPSRRGVVPPFAELRERYGYDIVINKIETWDIDEYAEVEIDRISPDWGQGVVTTHTINACTGLTVIDGQILCSRLF